MHFFRSLFRVTLAAFAFTLLFGARTPVAAGQAEYVIVISIDGGGASYIQNLIDQNLIDQNLPNFKRFQTEGSWTNNARNDFDYTITLPNHVTMITGLAVLGSGGNGHMWTGNVDPSDTPSAATYSLQNNKGSYIPSVFDVVHDNGLRTGLYATKTKFSLFDHSYNNGHGAPDTTGPDNGLNKIDAYVYNPDSSALTASFTTAMAANPFNYVMVHFTDGDTAGHASGWGSCDYNKALKTVDGYLGSIFALVTGNPALQGKTAIILTADHGGDGFNHADNYDPLDYTIPFYVWGPDVQAAADLYALNPTSRLNPGTGHPAYADPVQPIRNGESANLALKMLGLAAIPGSTINAAQNMSMHSEGHRSLGIAMTGAGGGTVTSSPAGISCTTGTADGCSASFVTGSSVQLTAGPDWKSLFAGWNDGGCSGTGTCTVPLSTDITVTANFTKDFQVKRANTATLYATIQDAYTEADAGETIQMRVKTFKESIIFDKTMRLHGGMDSDYSSTSGVTKIQGSLRFTQGTVEISNLVILGE